MGYEAGVTVIDTRITKYRSLNTVLQAGGSRDIIWRMCCFLFVYKLTKYIHIIERGCVVSYHPRASLMVLGRSTFG